MEQALIDVAIAIVTVIIGAVIGWMKRTGTDIAFEDKMVKYERYFKGIQALLENIDKPLADELAEAIQTMRDAYASESFTPDAFNQCVKECEDVLNRAKDIIAHKRA